jgi:urease accessory protein
MPRATSVQPAAQRQGGNVVDTLILTHAQRQTKRGFVFGIKGVCVEFDFSEPVRLRTDDALVLEDGSLVEIVSEAEPLIEARAADLPALARLAWHLGDRHVPIQILEKRLRLQHDPAIEELLAALGAKVIAIEAPFEPEGGAYEAQADDHHHDHGHARHNHHDGHDHHHHDHSAHDHQHGDACGCGHDHSHDHAHDHGDHHPHGHKHD